MEERLHEQLQDTVEALRAEEYPELDAALVADIMKIEGLHLNARGRVHIRLEQAIDAYLREAKAQ